MSMPWHQVRGRYSRSTIIRGLAAYARDGGAEFGWADGHDHKSPVGAMKWALERYDTLNGRQGGSLWSEEIRWLDRQAVIHYGPGPIL